MPKAAFRFPEGFLWGTATAAHQVEGGHENNNWSAWEKQPGRIVEDQKAGLACDWWGGRWKDDFDRAAETGQNAHRMSISWSRVQPEPDRWDENALDHYREMIRGLLERKMTPLITLHHFSHPLWLVEMGGWECEQAPELFERFARKVVGALKEYVSIWTTINEPNVFVYSAYLEGVFPPGKQDMGAAFSAMRNMLKGHARAYHAIHEMQKEAQVGVTINYRSFQPSRPNFLPDVWIANLLSQNFNAAFHNALVDGKFKFLFRRARVPEAIGTQDYVGVNYYTRDVVRFAPFKVGDFFNKRWFPQGAQVSETGFIANVPEGMFESLKWANKYGKPIWVLENGVEDTQDSLRSIYTIEHIHQIWRAVNQNIPVKGYFHWSLTDNFEWERGWTQRFGLWGLNTETQARIRQKSVDVYEDICYENGITSKMVEKYTPEIMDKLFPV